MSISYDGKMIVGVDYSEIPGDVIKSIEAEYEDFNDWCDANNLTTTSPWFDADIENWFIGVQVNSVQEENLQEWFAELQIAFYKVQELLKVKPRLAGVPHIT